MCRDNRRISLVTSEHVRLAGREKILMAIELPRELAITRHPSVEVGDPPVVCCRGALAGHRLERPVRARAHSRDPPPQWNGAERDLFRGLDRFLGSARTARPS